ncbi:MAG TPA: hypothetical protein VMP01_14475 [Pirellulaceae bacterium]|nr:hypothetical protein [Pirellulaceae bacterium]
MYIINFTSGAVSLLALTLFSVVSTSKATEPFSVEHFRNLLTQQRAQLASMKVSYSHEAAVEGKRPGPGESATREMNNKTFAFHGDLRAVRGTMTKTRGNGKTVASERQAVWDGAQCVIRTASLLRIQAEKSGHAEDNQFTNLMLWPLSADDLINASGEPNDTQFLPRMLDTGDWIVDGYGNVNGVNCTILRRSNGSRTLWLDAATGYSLQKYEWRNPSANRDVVRFEVAYSEHQQVVPGVYLPRRINFVQEFRDGKSDAVGGRLMGNLNVVELSANNVGLDEFRIDPRPGDLVINQITGTIYTFNPKDDQSLERSIRVAGAAMAVMPLPKDYTKYVYGGACLLVAAVAGYFGGRWIMKRG